MAVTSWFNCGTCADDSGMGTLVWYADDVLTALSGTECQSNDGTFAGVKGTSLGATHYLKCTNFGITNTDVPSGATIDGLEIEVRELRNANPTVASTVVRYVKGGSVVGNDIGVASDWPTSETAIAYGGSTQLGGQSWTDSDVTASNFGCVIGVNFNAIRLVPTNRNILVDQVRMRVYYTPSTPGTPAIPWRVAQTLVLPPETTVRRYWES